MRTYNAENRKDHELNCKKIAKMKTPAKAVLTLKDNANTIITEYNRVAVKKLKLRTTTPISKIELL